MTAVKVKIVDTEDNLLEEILLKSKNGVIEVPKNELISNGNYFVKGNEEYIQFKQMIRRKAQVKYNGKVGITFSKNNGEKRKGYLSRLFSF